MGDAVTYAPEPVVPTAAVFASFADALRRPYFTADEMAEALQLQVTAGRRYAIHLHLGDDTP